MKNGLQDFPARHKRVAALMTVHNRKDKTLRCLSKLFAQSLPEAHTLEVYLTDDGCTDGTPQAIRALYPQVNIIEGDGTLYWNRGMYRAWQEAAQGEHDFYLWLNDDTFLYEDALVCLLETSSLKSDCAIVVGPTDSPDHRKITYGGKDRKGRLLPVEGEVAEISLFHGNIVLIPASVYRVLGNVDYYYTHWRGDTDYGVRAAKAGIKMFQAGKALGMCDRDHEDLSWCHPDLPLSERIRLMNRPDGHRPNEMFHLHLRQHGLCKAIYYYLVIWTCCFFPHNRLRRR